MTGLRYSPLHVTELCGEMQGNFKVGCARLIIDLNVLILTSSLVQEVTVKCLLLVASSCHSASIFCR